MITQRNMQCCERANVAGDAQMNEEVTETAGEATHYDLVDWLTASVKLLSQING